MLGSFVSNLDEDLCHSRCCYVSYNSSLDKSDLYTPCPIEIASECSSLI